MVKNIGKVIIILGIALCTGCSSKDSENTSAEKNTVIEETQNADEFFKDSDIIQDNIPNQTYSTSSFISAIQDNIMYSVVQKKIDIMEEGMYIYAADLETGEQKPLCSKSGCEHDDKECNAYLGYGNLIISNMWCIDNVIYLFGNDGDNFLMRVSHDGSIKQKIGTVLTSSDLFSGNYIINISDYSPLIHRGFLYYTITECKNEKEVNNVSVYGTMIAKIYRYDISGSSEAECIYEYEVKDGYLSLEFAAQGEYLYATSKYSYYDYSEEEIVKSGEWDIEEYKINVNTLEKEQVISEINYCRSYEKNKIIYSRRYNPAGDIVTIEISNEDNLEYKEQLRTMKISIYNKETQETKYLPEEYFAEYVYFDVNDFWVTDKYICLNAIGVSGDLMGTYIFDFDWNLIARFYDSNYIDYCFGEYILWEKSDEGSYDFYIAKLEDYIRGNIKYGKLFTTNIQTIDMNSYIYDNYNTP